MELTEDCRKVISALSELIDGELDAVQSSALMEHIKTCNNCRVVFDTTKRTIQLYHDDNEAFQLPETVKKKLFEKLGLDKETQ